MESEKQRYQMLLAWLTDDLNLNISSIKSASNDASFRRYFRIKNHQGNYIAMDAPPEKENLQSFIKVATLFASAGLNVPDIFHKNLAHGFLLLEDFGDQCLLDKLDSNNCSQLYLSVMDSLFTLHSKININQLDLPQYNEPLLRREIEIFIEWFLQKHLQLSLTDKEDSILGKTISTLTESALEQTRVCVHRDFHSRNLMYLPESSPGIIDFQDAVIGPVTYDLVSLLRDCYIQWPETAIGKWVNTYYTRLQHEGIIHGDALQFKRWFDLMGLQRHLKAIGIFARLNLRDGKPNYLLDIPRTMKYVVSISNEYPELKEFSNFLKLKVLPTCNLHS